MKHILFRFVIVGAASFVTLFTYSIPMTKYLEQFLSLYSIIPYLLWQGTKNYAVT